MAKNDVTCPVCGAKAEYEGMKAKGPVFGAIQSEWAEKCQRKSDGVGACKEMLKAMSVAQIQS